LKWYFGWLKFIKNKVDLEGFKKKMVLEVGGGIGAFSTLLQKQGFEGVVCNDISEVALRLAKSFNPNLEIACFDIEEIKEKNKYDLVFALEVLEHLNVLKPKDWRGFFKRAGFKRVLTFPMSFPPLLYRLSKHLNFCLTFYIKQKYFVSTTLIVAYK
jgi:cyclopropane fatty-acyl-phospholipid synthase-like methyltransferase